MPERDMNIFRGADISPVRDYSEKEQTIVQGEVDPKILDRIKKAERGELKAKLAAVLDRGVVQDRLTVDLPDDVYGEWVRNDPLEIRRLEILGFKVDKKYATKRAIHSDGSDSAIVGDVIHMICPREVKEVIDEIRLEQTLKQHAKRKVGNRELNREEEEFLVNVANEGDDKVVAYTSSTERPVTRGSLASALNEVDSQIKKSNK